MVPHPQEPATPAVPDAPVTPAVPDPGTPGQPEEPSTVPTPEEPATPAVPEPGPEQPSPHEEPGPAESPNPAPAPRRPEQPAPLEEPAETSSARAKSGGKLGDADRPEAEPPLPAPPYEAVSFAVSDGGLPAVRGRVRAYGRDAGLRLDVLDDLQVVANELASNALRHGTPPSTVTLWRAAGRVICQVENGGAIAGPLPDCRKPGPEPERGMGLWIVHHLCDVVEVRNGARTTVRAQLAVD